MYKFVRLLQWHNPFLKQMTSIHHQRAQCSACLPQESTVKIKTAKRGRVALIVVPASFDTRKEFDPALIHPKKTLPSIRCRFYDYCHSKELLDLETAPVSLQTAELTQAYQKMAIIKGNAIKRKLYEVLRGKINIEVRLRKANHPSPKRSLSDLILETKKLVFKSFHGKTENSEGFEQKL